MIFPKTSDRVLHRTSHWAFGLCLVWGYLGLAGSGGQGFIKMRKDNIRERAILEFYIMDMYGQNGGEILTVMQVFLGLVISIFVCGHQTGKTWCWRPRCRWWFGTWWRCSRISRLGVCPGNVQQVAPLDRSIFPHCVFHISDLSVPHFKMS